CNRLGADGRRPPTTSQNVWQHGASVVLSATERRLAVSGDAGVSVLLRACCLTSVLHAGRQKKFLVDSGNQRQHQQLRSTCDSASSFVRGIIDVASTTPS